MSLWLSVFLTIVTTILLLLVLYVAKTTVIIIPSTIFVDTVIKNTLGAPVDFLFRFNVQTNVVFLFCLPVLDTSFLRQNFRGFEKKTKQLCLFFFFLTQI